jgi:hypothetical protein
MVICIAHAHCQFTEAGVKRNAFTVKYFIIQLNLEDNESDFIELHFPL